MVEKKSPRWDLTHEKTKASIVETTPTISAPPSSFSSFAHPESPQSKSEHYTNKSERVLTGDAFWQSATIFVSKWCSSGLVPCSWCYFVQIQPRSPPSEKFNSSVRVRRTDGYTLMKRCEKPLFLFHLFNATQINLLKSLTSLFSALDPSPYLWHGALTQQNPPLLPSSHPPPSPGWKYYLSSTFPPRQFSFSTFFPIFVVRGAWVAAFPGNVLTTTTMMAMATTMTMTTVAVMEADKRWRWWAWEERRELPRRHVDGDFYSDDDNENDDDDHNDDVDQDS